MFTIFGFYKFKQLKKISKLKDKLQNFIDDNLWDEARVFTANKKLIQGLTAPSFDAKIKVSEKLAGDRLDFYFN